MKLYRISLLLLLSALVLVGCIDDDLSSCPNHILNNLRLEFFHTDDKGVDLFKNNIHDVEIFVYDLNGLFVTKKHIDKQKLNNFAGTDIGLSPGSYRIVIWANTFDKTQIYKPEKGSFFSDARVNFGLPNAQGVSTGGDPLYYASYYTANVKSPSLDTATIKFRSAHVKIEVYIKGFIDNSSGGQALLPIVEITDIYAGYNFDLEPFDPSIIYKDISTNKTKEGNQLAAAEFYTPLFEENKLTKVIIRKQSDGSVVTIINLEDFIKDNNIVITGVTTQVVIPIFIEYKQGAVNIKLAEWKETPVKPEM